MHRPDLITLPRVFRSSRLLSKEEYRFTVFWVRQKLTLSRGLPDGCSCWVNTLSAKADSFFEHPAYWRGCARLARSRPGTLKNVPGGILISIHHKATFASVNAFSQRLGNVVAERGADLARVVREHLFYFTSSLCNFVCEYGDEARPCDVGNRSGKSVVPDHPLDVQAFHSNLAVARDQVIGNFVPVFSAKVSPSFAVSNIELA